MAKILLVEDNEMGRDTLLRRLEELDGRPILVRFAWSDITRTGARWEQAFSPDEGKTWETNWVMTMSREEG